MKTTFKKLTSLLLSFVIVLGMLPAVTPHNCNLGANPQYMLEFSGTAACVKAFMMETDGGFTPRCASVADEDLNS